MGDKDTSLNKYRNTLLTSGQPANNFNRTGSGTVPGGRQDSVKYTSISKNMPGVSWNSYSSKDPILNFGSTSSSLKGGGFLNFLSDAANVVTLVGGAALTGVSIYSAVQAAKGNNSSSNAGGINFSRKETKEINRNTTDGQNEMQALDNAITTAESLIDSNDTKNIERAHENIMGAIQNAQSAVNEANRNITTAQATQTNWINKKADKKTEYDNLLNDKTTLSNRISELEKIDASQMTPEQKAELAEAKKQLKEIENKLKKLEEEIADIDKEIAKYQTIIDKNKQVVNDLNANISTAKSLEKKLANQTGVDK